MYTADDFIAAAAANINNYPAIAALYNAGDPTITQRIGAMATMLAMLSSQIETAQAEPFDKVRDATVYADAAIRGIIPQARQAQHVVTINNGSSLPYTLAANKVLTDSIGNQYTVQTPVTVAAGANGTFNVTQGYTQTYSYTVSGSVPFYAIQLPTSIDGSYLAAVNVSDAAGGYTYANEYINVGVGDRVFHLESDDQQNVYVRFGYSGIVGFQPTDGTVITISITWAMGLITLNAGSPFALQYLLTPQESQLTFALSSVIDAGADPIDITTLRDFSRYPSVYDSDAVYLGEFDFLVRRAFSDAQFISVWNETQEEAARGANVTNINKLFFAFVSAAGTETTVSEPQNTVASTSTFTASGVAGNYFLTATTPQTIAAGSPIAGLDVLPGSVVSSRVTASTNIPLSQALSASPSAQTYTITNAFGAPIANIEPNIVTSPTVGQAEIATLINNADDGYRIQIYTAVNSFIYINITAVVSSSYVTTDVQSQISALILANYGQSAPAAQHPGLSPLYQAVYQMLINNITALTDGGGADFQLTISPYPGPYRPELWRYVDPTSLTINVTNANITTSGWRSN